MGYIQYRISWLEIKSKQILDTCTCWELGDKNKFLQKAVCSSWLRHSPSTDWQLPCSSAAQSWSGNGAPGLYCGHQPSPEFQHICHPYSVCGSAKVLSRSSTNPWTQNREAQADSCSAAHFWVLAWFTFSFGCRIGLGFVSITQKSAKRQEAPTLMKFLTNINGALPSDICPEVKLNNFGNAY